MYSLLIKNLQAKKNLTEKEIGFFVSESVNGEFSEEQKVGVLTLLTEKGVGASEVSFFAKVLQGQCQDDLVLPESTDVCGTGGSGLTRINTSTISAFILASLGISIAKHGNKAASGRFGSFDLLESLNINITPPKEFLSYAYWKEDLAFLFARQHFPAMKHFAAVRQMLGFPTVFNILGPLINPTHPTYQLIGTPFEDKMELLVRAALKLGRKKVVVVRGEDNLDEVTLTGKTTVVEGVQVGELKKYIIEPQDFGVEPAKFQEIAGGEKTFNIKITEQILKGECKTRHEDLVLVNTALVLKMHDKVKNLKEGYLLAKKVLKTKLVYEKFLAYQKISQSQNKCYEITGNKYQELVSQKQYSTKGGSKRSVAGGFKRALSVPGVSLIAEVKKASPSKGVLCEKGFDPARIAENYERSGASAISVLTDEKYFQGNLGDLKKVRSAADLPILRKDFIIEDSQVFEAADAGASAVLLIASVLSDEQIERFLSLGKKLGLDCLVEVHTAEELERVLCTQAEIIGINNRDLSTLKIDVQTTNDILEAVRIPADKIVVSESGIKSSKDIARLSRRVDAVLVGTKLMESPDTDLLCARKIFKACGVRTESVAKFCEKENVDLVGLNFVPSSKRCVSLEQAKKIRSHLCHTKTVGVFQNQPISLVNKYAKILGLDFVQLSGDEDLDFVSECNVPVIKTVKLRTEQDIQVAKKYFSHCAFILFDGAVPGSGELSNYDLLKGVDFPFLFAGGVNDENVKKILADISPVGIDAASGIEIDGEVSDVKIGKFLELLGKDSSD